MWFTKLKLIAAGLLAAGIVAAGAGVSGNYLGSGDGPTPDQQDKQANNRPPDDGRPDDQAGEPSDRSPVVDTPTGGDVRKQALEKIDPRSIEPIGPQPIEPSDRPPTVDALRGQDVRKQALEKIGPRSIEPIGPQLVNGLDPIAAERLKAAIEYAKAAKEFYERGTVTIDRYISASQRLMEAQQDPAQTPAQHREAAEAHAARMKTLETLEGSKLQAGISSIPNVAEARLAVAEAEYLLHRAQGSQRPDEPELPRSNADQEEHFKLGQLVLGEAVVRRQGSAPGDDGPGSRLVLTALEEPIAMRFANETPLEDIIQYIKEATQSADLPNGIPVYVDPIGLNEAEVTETSPVTIALEGVPLKRTLQLALRQIRLAYGIKDGVLIISAPGGPLEELLLEPSIFEPSEATILEVKAKRGEISDEEIQRLERLKEARPMPSGSGFQ